MQVATDTPYNASLSAVIIRADGTRIELGTVDAHYSNPIKQWVWDHFNKPRAIKRARRANKGVNLNG